MAALYVPPPPGTNYIAVIEPSLTLLIIVLVWTSFLVPIAIALFLFSTPALRRRPIFFLNVISIAFGLFHGALYIYNQTRVILLRPLEPGFFVTLVILSFLIPMFAEFILLIRVYAVYPPRITPRLALIAVYAPIAAFKIARLTNNIMFTVQWVEAVTRDPTNFLQSDQAGVNGPYAKIEWFLMLFDNSYTSLLFLYRLREGSHGTVRTGPNAMVVSSGAKSSYGARLEALFWIAASNFVFPVLLNIVQLIFVFRSANPLDSTYVFIVNLYVHLIGVLLATLWCTGSRWLHDGGSWGSRTGAERMHAMSSIRFPPVRTNDSGSSVEPACKSTVRCPEESSRCREPSVMNVETLERKVDPARDSDWDNTSGV